MSTCLLRRVALLGITTAVPLSSVGAQETQPASPAKGQGPAAVAPHTLRLRKALDAMATLDSMTFESAERRSSNIANPFAVAGGGGAKATTTRMTGALVGGVLTASHKNNEIVAHGARMVAREGSGRYRMRYGRWANGAKMPFLLRPGTLFAGLRDAGLEVTRSEVTTREDRPVEILTTTVKGKAAHELVYGGLMPDLAPDGGSDVFVMFGGVGGRKPTEPDLTLDLAFFIDPATSRVHQIKMRGYSKSNHGIVMAGGGGAGAVRVVMRRGGVVVGGLGEADEEEEDEAEANQAPVFKDGLPLRKKHKGGGAIHFDVRFDDHGVAAAAKLDARTRRLLGLPPQ